MRDFTSKPYSVDEQRVCDYLTRIADAGCGEDPIGFLIASHGALVERVAEQKRGAEVLLELIVKLASR